MKHLKLIFACLLTAFFSIGQVWAADPVEITISYADIPDGYKATSGTSGSFTVTVAATNDLTINYAGINTKSSASAADHSYGYAMFLKNYGYLYSGAAPTGYYPSNVKVTFSSGTGVSGKAGITYGSSALNSRNSSVTGTVAKSGTCELSNSNQSNVYWNFSTTGANVQVAKIELTYSPTTSNPALSLDPPTLSVDDKDVEQQSITLTTSNFASAISTVTTGLFSDAECTSAITSDAWVKNITVNGEKTAITFDVDDNNGAQRQCWLKISASDGTDVASAILPITQALYVAPLTTMQEIFDAATGTATATRITFNSDWVVTGVSTNGKTAYLTDGTKGLILYNGANSNNPVSTLAAGNTLSGTVERTLKLFNGAAELDGFTLEGLTVGTGGTITVNELNDEGIAALTAVNTGSVIKISGEAAAGSIIAGVTIYNTLSNFTAPTAGHNYECTGVYLYYKSGNNAAKNEILPRSASDLVEIVAAGDPEFTPKSTKFVGSIDVTLSQGNNQDIYYTDDETKKDVPSTTDWTSYENPIHIEATKTLYAAAWSGSEWSNVVFETYTSVTPLTTMAEVQAEGTGSQKEIDVTITNWVVTAVDGQYAWITDADNAKGILLFKSGHGFVVGKKLNGTVFNTKIKQYNNYPELTSLVAGDVTITNADAITPRLTTIAALTSGHPAEQGIIVKLENLAYDGTNFSDGTKTITIDTRFYEPTLTSGKRYNLAGVVWYGNSSAIIKLMPRSADDVEELADKTLSSISLSGDYPVAFETGDEFSHEGLVVTAHYADESSATVTTSATFSGYDMSNADSYTVTVSYTENEVIKTATYTITVSDPAPTGDFEELEGELVAGDYLIYEGGSLMKAEISSDRFTYAEQEPDANGVISNPSRYVVWTLAQSGSYWTFYNAKTNKYAAGTGSKNTAQLLADGTDNKSLWSIDAELVVTNKVNTAANVNATLRHNYNTTNNYGFACYSADQGGKPVFYKKADPSYSITAALTGCTADANNAKKVPQTGLTEDVVLKYNLTVGYVWPDAITVTVGGVALDPNELDYLWDTDKTPAELTIDYTKINGNIAVSITAIEKELDNITIAQVPNKVAYETGEFFNPSGLQISLNYTAGASDVVEYSDNTKADFTFSPDLETALAPANTEVTITYGGKSVNQAITVTDPVLETKTVVIIAEFDSKFYAMSNAVANSQCVAIEVTKNGDNLVVSSDEDKAAIQWYMSKLGSTVNLQEADENGKYLSGNSSNASFAESDDKVDLTMTQADGKYIISAGGARAIMYRSTGVFKHYATSSSESEYAKVSEIFEVADGATNIEVVVPVVYEFTIDPDEDVAFGTVEQGDDIAAKSFDVTLTNIASATVTLSDDAAFSIDVTALTADGTITVTPNTANAGNFSATITLHDEANEAADKVINVTMKVVTPKDCDREDDFNTVGTNSSYLTRNSTDGWNAENTAVVSKDDVTYWMINGKTTAKGVITSPEFNYGIKQLSLDYYYSFTENNGISFKVEIKQSGSVVKTENITKADAVKGTVYSTTIEDINVAGKYQIVITNLCPSNSTSNADRFAIGNLCWKKYGEPVAEEVRSGLEANRYYTLCLGRKMAEVQGATFWSFAGKDASMAYIVQEEAPFEAGKPYIIYAETAGNLTAILDGKVTTTAGHNNGLYGTLSYMDADALSSAGATHMLKSNELRPIGSNNHLDANRAYVILAEISGGKPSNVPAHKVRGIPTQGTESQGVDNLNASETPVKMMIDGQLLIIRGEKMYDATGRLVK